MYKIIKRTADFLVSLFLIIILLPVLIPISILLKLTGEGYVFYFQNALVIKINTLISGSLLPC